jgi:hypothetical protein
VPEGLCAATPNETFQIFREYLNGLLHRTITDVPLVQIIQEDRAFLQFRRGGDSVAVDVGKGYHLYLAQTLRAVKQTKREYRLRTLHYAYRIAEGPEFEDEWFFRWEYNSREHEPGLHPRHHCHIPVSLDCLGQTLSLAKMHIATGWVTIEEVIRFLIHELKVRPKSNGWDQHLRDSEEKFRQWTARGE